MRWDNQPYNLKQLSKAKSSPQNFDLTTLPFLIDLPN